MIAPATSSQVEGLDSKTVKLSQCSKDVLGNFTKLTTAPQLETLLQDLAVRLSYASYIAYVASVMLFLNFTEQLNNALQ